MQTLKFNVARPRRALLRLPVEASARWGAARHPIRVSSLMFHIPLTLLPPSSFLLRLPFPTSCPRRGWDTPPMGGWSPHVRRCLKEGPRNPGVPPHSPPAAQTLTTLSELPAKPSLAASTPFRLTEAVGCSIPVLGLPCHGSWVRRLGRQQQL